MNKIALPLKFGTRSAAVADLQDALRHLLAAQTGRLDEAERQALADLLRERADTFYGEATRVLVCAFQRLHRLPPSGEVDRDTADALNGRLGDEGASHPLPVPVPAYAVKGHVRLADGTPLPRIKVSAFDRDLRSEQPLGEAETDAAGLYQIRYGEPQFRAAELGSADLVVKAFAADGALLASSPIVFNAPPLAEVDLVVAAAARRPPSLFEKIAAAFAPLLGDIKVEELDEDDKHQDLTFLAGETGFGKATLARFIFAHRLTRPGLPPEFWFALLGGPFVSYVETLSLRRQLPMLLDTLTSIDGAAARKALDASFAQNDVPASLQGKTAGWVEAFLAQMGRHLVAGATAPTFAKLALDHAGITGAEKQQKFARLFNQYKALTPDLLAALEKDSAFTGAEVADLRTSFRLGELTRADFSVVKMLKDEFKARQPEQIRILAKQSPQQWTALIAGKAASGDIKVPVDMGDLAAKAKVSAPEVYGTSLERRFRETYPTAAFLGGLDRALNNGGAHGLRHAAELKTFLDRHDGFELMNTPIDKFLDSGGVHPELRETARSDAFRSELKAVQRVFKVAPTYAAADALLADGVHSAQMIYRMGQSTFVKRYAAKSGMSAPEARLAWNKAADTHAAVVTVVGDLKAFDGEGLPLVLKNGTDALSTFPNWNNLFQGGDMCTCEECRSVLGPAAYFADLLVFLKDRKALDPAFTVKDILFARRPDLGFIELDCDNALTPLPYVDVVCEVLEKVIAGDADDLELPGFTAMPAGSAAIQAAVLAAFAGQSIDLAATFSVTQIHPADPNRWVVHGDDVTYLLKKKATANFFAEVLPNTKADAAELRAYPAYVNPKAYDQLRQARFPFALPFDLFAEEARAAFAKCNIARWDLMRTLRGAAGPSDADVAAEYFGISVDAAAPFDEKRLILIADGTTAGQQAAWGETGHADFINTIAVVKTFLAKTGLEYDDLLALLDLRFVNPAGDITIRHLDSSCDTDKKRLENLDAAKLDRIHRFLRMWRKLGGWKMFEVDLVLRHAAIGAGSLDEPFLIRLFHFGRLRSRLGPKTTVEQLCALFGNLGTETHFTAAYKKRADGLYQSLFLNKKHIRPLDHAFDVAAVDVPAPTAEKISGHAIAVLGALGVRQADLDIFAGLTRASDGTAYITDDLTLANLSFLWRHAWLARQLKLKAADWKIVLKLMQQDIAAFADPKAAMDFVETVDRLGASGFKPDELDWLLAANRAARAAPKETDTARALSALRKALQAIAAEYDPAQYPFLNPPSSGDSLPALLTSLLQKLQRGPAGAQFFLDTLQDTVSVELAVAGLPAGFDFPDPIKAAINIRYDAPRTTLRFTGLMTPAQRTTLLTDPSLAAVTGIAAYQQAIAEFFQRPRLALKFFAPNFSAPLDNLPPAVDFKTLAEPLKSKIGYDADNRLLTLAGILTPDEKAALDALSADGPYLNAVNSLYAQPVLGVFPPQQIWLEDADLQFPLRDLADAANDNLAANLAAAVTKALAYLLRTESETLVVQQAAAQFALSESLARILLTQYAVLPDTLLSHLTTAFAATGGAVDYATLKTTFDGWTWAGRVAALWNKWKLTRDELARLLALGAGANLLDFLSLPLDATRPIAPFDRFLRASRLMRVRDALPEAKLTLLQVLAKLAGGGYATAADFAADVILVNDAWTAADVTALVAALDAAYPNDYLLAETWERVRAAFAVFASLNAGTDTVKAFAAATMTADHAKTLKNLLRSKFGDTWLDLSGEIQDALRDRKRASLDAYILTLPQPADAPSGKWENTNDLYAYYLLDVEMCACQLTSRLVQASGSVQLFVQRCFMGLEPKVAVEPDGDDGDSAWHWWTWMRKYRVWEANRKVFLWPENWIEPELKKDRSVFFKELESDLQQNDINTDSVEQAYEKYLEKLDSVARLEIAGFYQEDDGDNTIIHVFGRTTGTDPHLYYYRRFDYRQWTPWEKVELDIQGDYLVPAVVAGRLYLFWPVFSEVQDESKNNSVDVPDLKQSSFPIKKTSKKLRMQMAVSDYRQGKWTPKRISKEYDESASYDVELVKKYYRFFAVDRSEIDGRFGVRYDGYSVGADQATRAELFGAFEIAGCAGVPIKAVPRISDDFEFPVRPEPAATGDYTIFLKWDELAARKDSPHDDLTLENIMASGSDWLRNTPILMQTPWLFRVSPAWQLSYLDKLVYRGLQVMPMWTARNVVPAGSWLPFFYDDKKRTFFVLPSLWSGGRDTERSPNGALRFYYPDIKAQFHAWDDGIRAAIGKLVDAWDPSTLSAADRQNIELFLSQKFSGEPPPPYSDPQLKTLMARYFTLFFEYYLGQLAVWLFQYRQYEFRIFYHPFVCDFLKRVYNPLQGIPGLMRRETQLQDSGFSFKQNYRPTFWVVDPTTESYYPHEDVDFRPAGAYASYNWELFFHAPLLIANSLSRNQRFAEARDWYHYIFNPIGVESQMPGGSAMSKYWITKPFYQTTDKQYVQQRIENIMRMLAGDTTVPDASAQAKLDLEHQVLDWRNNPFEPHRIANYRTVAYQKTVVMKYLDNLIAWGDYLFAQDSMESINEATQLYVLAAEILGPKPKKIPPQAKPPVESFNELEDSFDKFSNALVQVENLIPPMQGGQNGAQSAPLPMLYFCIPHNDKMLGYWDTIADRLYKIRHCMNIEGVVRQLALFEPPIDPGALVKAVAGGMDIASALAELNAPLPLYRFSVLVQKANEVCADVKALGSALLAALEKKDAEALSLLRQSQEIRVLEAVKAVRRQQLDEAKENLNGIRLGRQVTEFKKQFYASREFMNTAENVAHALNTASTAIDAGIAIGYGLAGGLKLIPDFVLGASGFGGSPHAVVETGGKSFGDSAEDMVRTLESITHALDKMASISSTIASYQRRQDDWNFQRDLADKELKQTDSQIAAAELRIAIAQQELDNQNLQIDNAKAIDDFMHGKYTNAELYQWQIGQISAVYFKSYKLAYDLAKRAERCLRFELGLQDSSFINFGYWDSLKKGLLSGEQLQYDLRRLEAAYLDRNRRELELTKHVSLALADPLALVTLRETGRCVVRLPEEMFDLDYPGHYFRRVKSVSLTLPCVAGPYTTISCTLRLLKNSIRINTANGDNGYPRNTDDAGLPADDDRFVENNIPVKAIAASGGQNDSGMFELNFRDDRYLPFEGAGAVSEWSLELFNDLASNNPDPTNPDFGKPLRQFDYATISDAVLHVKYTAREDAGPFKNGAVGHLRDYYTADGATPSFQMLSLRRDFPSEWARFLNPANPANGNVFDLSMSSALFRVLDADKTLKVNRVVLFARCSDAGDYGVVMTPPLPPPPAGSNSLTLARSDTYGGLHFATGDVSADGIEIVPTDPPVKWQIKMTRPGGGNLQSDPATAVMEVQDVILLLGYEWA